MSDVMKYLLMALVPIGLILFSMFAFWVVLPVVIIGIAARLLYLKLFRKEKTTVHMATFSLGWGNNASFGKEINANQEYTTVIDADNMDREYQIPKMK